MHWIALSLLSAVFLGFYEIAKKASVRNNAVPPVLFFNVLTSALVYLPLILCSHFTPELSLLQWIRVDPIGWEDHLRLALKSVIAGSSWVFASFALKHLPMSIAAPIRASSPFVTILFAVAVMGERPTPAQWAGVTVVVIAFYAFSLVGRREGIHFHKDRWIGLMIVATLLGAVSALYDKYLLHTCGMKSATVQAWFAVYLVALMAPICGWWFIRDRQKAKFEWRWSIPMIALLLLVSDYLYFSAIEQDGGLISVISPLRRTSIIIAFIAGIRLYGELNWRPKLACILCILIGVYIISSTRS